MKDKKIKELKKIITALTVIIFIFLIIGLGALAFAITGKVKGNKEMASIAVIVMMSCIGIELILGTICSGKFLKKKEEELFKNLDSKNGGDKNDKTGEV